MNIGFFTDAYLPSGEGVGNSIESFRKGLEKMGHRVYIFAPRFPRYRDQALSVFRFKSLKIIREPEMRLVLPFLDLKTVGQIKKLKLDIIHTHTPFTLGWLGEFIAFRKKLPLVYTHHTYYSECAKIYAKEKILLPRMAKALVAGFSYKCDLVIAPSVKAKELLRENRVKTKICILPTGIDLELFKKPVQSKDQLRASLNLPLGKKILLYVGRINKEKNIDFLASMLKDIPDEKRNSIKLLIIGKGSYLEDFKKKIDVFSLGPLVEFLGQIPYQQLAAFYQSADLFVYSSLGDIQPLVISEAVACGLPVIVLRDDAFKDFVIQNKNGFLIKGDLTNPRTSQIFAQKVLDVLENPVLAKRFSNYSLRIANNFSIENQARKLADIYRRLKASKT